MIVKGLLGIFVSVIHPAIIVAIITMTALRPTEKRNNIFFKTFIPVESSALGFTAGTSFSFYTEILIY